MTLIMASLFVDLSIIPMRENILVAWNISLFQIFSVWNNEIIQWYDANRHVERSRNIFCQRSKNWQPIEIKL